MVNEQPAGDPGGPRTRVDRAERLQVLATEHWSLLATRSITYGESFSRVGMFLSVLTGAVISLALLAQVDKFDGSFKLAAVLILSVVLFFGLATLGRLVILNREDYRWIAGMNRLRRAYLDEHPDLEPYFLTDSHDDLRGIRLTLGYSFTPGRSFLADAPHAFTTLPALLGVMVAAVAGVLSALVASWLGASEVAAVIFAAVVFLVALLILLGLSWRAFVTWSSSLPTRFPLDHA